MKTDRQTQTQKYTQIKMITVQKPNFRGQLIKQSQLICGAYPDRLFTRAA